MPVVAPSQGRLERADGRVPPVGSQPRPRQGEQDSTGPGKPLADSLPHSGVQPSVRQEIRVPLPDGNQPISKIAQPPCPDKKDQTPQASSPVVDVVEEGSNISGLCVGEGSCPLDPIIIEGSTGEHQCVSLLDPKMDTHTPDITVPLSDPKSDLHSPNTTTSSSPMRTIANGEDRQQQKPFLESGRASEKPWRTPRY